MKYIQYKGEKETIYTWLRNQIGHTQKYTELEKFYNKINQYVGKLDFIVKRSLIYRYEKNKHKR